MHDLEILAQLKKSYNYILDIVENGSVLHCCGQLSRDNTLTLEDALNKMSNTYESFYSTLNQQTLILNKTYNSEHVYISNNISSDYMTRNKEYIDYKDLDGYCWYADITELIDNEIDRIAMAIVDEAIWTATYENESNYADIQVKDYNYEINDIISSLQKDDRVLEVAGISFEDTIDIIIKDNAIEEYINYMTRILPYDII